LTWENPTPDTIPSLRSVYRERGLLEEILDVNTGTTPYGPCVAKVRDAYKITYFETPVAILAYFDCLDSDYSGALSSKEIPKADIVVGDTNADGVIEVTELDPKMDGAGAIATAACYQRGLPCCVLKILLHRYRMLCLMQTMF